MSKGHFLRKTLSILLSLSATASLLFGASSAAMTVSAAGLSSSDFLKTDGTSIRNNYGSGDTVYLRGTNAGGWLVQENWMCATNATDQKTMMNTLANRFGSTVRDELIATYEDAYWTDADFDNCAAMGMSVIRLPFTYMNLCNDDGSLKSGAFNQIDWFVSNCAERGMYVILDMHGAFGSQNGMDHSGEVNDGTGLYYSSDNRAKTIALWEAIAAHYKDNPAVAGYDLLNEPGIKAASTGSLQWNFYDELYDAIRAIDSNHIIIMESCWDASGLPDPDTYGWSNVMYEYHYYPWNYQSDAAGQAAFTASKVSDLAAADYGVPVYVGEFTCFDEEDAWENAMSTYNEQGWNWTTWTYKVTGTSSWGIYNYSASSVDIYNDSADTIRAKWSAVGTSSGSANAKIYNVVSKYLSGTIDSSGGVTFYQDSNYGGSSVSLGVGEYNMNNLISAGIPNDSISSISVSSGYTVTLYKDINFAGTTKVLTASASTLGDFDNQTTCVKITRTSSGDGSFSEGEYYITAIANGGVVCAENAGAEPLYANRESCGGAWEAFVLEDNGDGTVSFKSSANGKYVCAVIDEDCQLLARSDSIGTWERFYIENITGDEYAIKAYANDKYVKADLYQSAKLTAVSDTVVGAWEAFKITKVGSSSGLTYDSSLTEQGVTFHGDSNYGGYSVTLNSGNYNYNDIVSAGIANDSLSSVSVPTGYKVTLYDNINYGGTTKVLTSDAAILGEMDNKTSSVKIEKTTNGKAANILDGGEYYITSIANGGVVCAESAGADPLIANRSSCSGAWESFVLENNGDGTVSFKSVINGNYVCAVADEDNQLLARSSSIGTWEKFYIENIKNDEYAVKAVANGNYVQANLDENGKLLAVSSSVSGAWEAFKITKTGSSSGLTYSGEEQNVVATFYGDASYGGWSAELSPGEYNYNAMVSAGIKNDALSSVKVPQGYKVVLYADSNYGGSTKTLFEDTSSLDTFNDKTSSLKIEKINYADFSNSNCYITSLANSKVVCADNTGADPLAADRDSCSGAWETFAIVNNSDGTVSFKSVANNKYVCAVLDEDSQLLARSSSIGTWEKFYIEEIADGEYAIRCADNNLYVKADLDNGGQLVATSSSVAGAWEAFSVTTF